MKKAIAMLFLFVRPILFNILLPSFDTYSDVMLAYKTFTFNLGESLLLSGCRVCQGKDEIEIYNLKNKSCQQCLTSLAGSLDYCGKSYEVLDKLYDLERKDTCENEHLSFALNYNSTTKSYNLKHEKCDHFMTDNCCVENINRRNISTLTNPLDKSFFAMPTSFMGHDPNKMIYLSYLLSGKLSMQHCQGVFLNYFQKSIQSFYDYVNKNLTALNSPIKANIYLKFTQSSNGKISLENGYTNEDGCGILLKSKQDHYVDNIDSIAAEHDASCGLDSCLIHLQSLRFKLNISSLDDWKYKTYYKAGTKLGGQTCQLLWKYGLVILVPVLLNMAFHSFVFFEDLGNGKATMVDIIFVPLLFYPQWKMIRILGTFVNDRNKDKLNEEMDKFECEVGSMEPFLESAIQVS